MNNTSSLILIIVVAVIGILLLDNIFGFGIVANLFALSATISKSNMSGGKNQKNKIKK